MRSVPEPADAPASAVACCEMPLGCHGWTDDCNGSHLLHDGGLEVRVGGDRHSSRLCGRLGECLQRHLALKLPTCLLQLLYLLHHLLDLHVQVIGCLRPHGIHNLIAHTHASACRLMLCLPHQVIYREQVQLPQLLRHDDRSPTSLTFKTQAYLACLGQMIPFLGHNAYCGICKSDIWQPYVNRELCITNKESSRSRKPCERKAGQSFAGPHRVSSADGS